MKFCSTVVGSLVWYLSVRIFVCNGWGISLVGGEECEVGGDVVLSGS